MSMSSEIVKPWSFPKNCDVPDRSAIKPSVKRRIFDCDGGENVKQLLHEENIKNKKYLRDKFNIEEQDLCDSPKKTSTENRGQNTLTKETTNFPHLINVELLNHQKSLDEKRANINHFKEITPLDRNNKGKCKASTSKNQEDIRQNIKQKHITDCFAIRKKNPPSEIKQETSLELRTAQSHISCPLDQTHSESEACKVLELTPKATRQFSQSEPSKTPDGLRNSSDMTGTADISNAVAAGAGAGRKLT